MSDTRTPGQQSWGKALFRAGVNSSLHGYRLRVYGYREGGVWKYGVQFAGRPGEWAVRTVAGEVIPAHNRKHAQFLQRLPISGPPVTVLFRVRPNAPWMTVRTREVPDD